MAEGPFFVVDNQVWCAVFYGLENTSEGMVAVMPLCPVCNGLAAVDENCPVCGGRLVDGGVLRDYYDDYSAYLEQDLYEDGYSCFDDSHCVHLFACPRCHYDTRLRFEKLAEERLLD